MIKDFLRKIAWVIILLSFLNGGLSAAPMGLPAGSDTSVTCSSPVTIWLENFTLPDGTISGSGATTWSVTNTSPSKNSVFAVESDEFRANDITINGLGTWISGVINIAGKTNVNISVDVRSAGGLTSDATPHADYLRIYYKIDGGEEVLFSDNEGKVNNDATGNTTVSVGSLGGSTLQIIIRAKATATSEFYFFDNIKVTGGAPHTVSAAAGVSGAGSLTCTTSWVTLTGSSSTTGVTYSWSGPGGFTSALQTPAINMVGTYALTVTDSLGCTASTTVTIAQDTAKPSAVATSSVPANALLTCSTPFVTLTGSSSTAGVTYSWSGPGGVASGAVDTVTAPGNYIVTVTNPVNGCTTTVTAATVLQNTTVPGAVSASVSDKLSCNNTSVTLTGNSTTAGVTYTWSGPGGFDSPSRVTTTTVGGAFILTATDPSNGCSFSRSITVVADLAGPAGVTAINDGSLSCTVGSVDLTGNSTTPGVTYTWTGPNGFFDPEQVTSVTDSGTYFLTVSNPGNGCTTTASTTVTEDLTECSLAAPKAVTDHAAALDATIFPAAGASGLTYKVYPNPVRSMAFVDLRSPGNAHVTVEVYNSLGMREKELFDGVVEAGVGYHWALDASRLAVGMHYCMIRMNNRVYAAKVVCL